MVTTDCARPPIKAAPEVGSANKTEVQDADKTNGAIRLIRGVHGIGFCPP